MSNAYGLVNRTQNRRLAIIAIYIYAATAFAHSAFPNYCYYYNRYWFIFSRSVY